MSGKPTETLLRGTLADPIYVLSLPDIRDAEILATETACQTADGEVTGRAGDVVVTAYGGERYPIPSRVFFGTYEVLGQVGNRLVARRLIHVRTAWEVLSDDAELDYGPTRGVVSVTRGGWLYRSDDDDFGLINPQVKSRGHVEVGPVERVGKGRWPLRFEAVALFLALLPPLLTAIALFALGLPHEADSDAAGLVILETVLLLIGVGMFAWVRAAGWAVKAAVSAGAKVAARFQIAVELLGEKASTRFPQMSLWRAAQAGPGRYSALDSAASASVLEQVRERIASTVSDFERELSRNHRIEHVGTIGATVAVIAVVCANVVLLMAPHLRWIELTALWLPSLIGALHSLGQRKRVSERVPLLRELIAQLTFVKSRLQALASSTALSPEAVAQGEVVLRLLCRVIGEYSQAELRHAIAQRPNLPV